MRVAAGNIRAGGDDSRMCVQSVHGAKEDPDDGSSTPDASAQPRSSLLTDALSVCVERSESASSGAGKQLKLVHGGVFFVHGGVCLRVCTARWKCRLVVVRGFCWRVQNLLTLSMHTTGNS